jgi:thiol-disulfide isomerase/thioredoxin
VTSNKCGISLVSFFFAVWFAVSISAPAVAGDSPDVAKLVRRLCVDEYKIHDVKSMYLRLRGRLTRTPEGIADAHARLEAQDPECPATEFTPERFPDLRPEITEELERAFDAKHLRLLNSRKNSQFQLRIWDGKQAIHYQEYDWCHSKQYAYIDTPKRFLGDNFFDELSCFRLGFHSFWWNSRPAPSAAEQDLCYGKQPVEYRLIGKRLFRGHECYVLQSRNQLLVDVKYNRLRGILHFCLPRKRTWDPGRVREVERRIAAKPLATDTGFAEWTKNLSPEEQRRFSSRLQDALVEEFGEPMSDFFMDDYREVAPGFWFPMRQGYVAFDNKNGRSFETFRREFEVVEIKVNKPLPDTLFTMEMREGITVNDLRGPESWNDPPLLYPYKRNRSSTEWQGILDAHRKEVDRVRKERADRERRIGQVAIEFGNSAWLNSKPLKFADLRGKVVVLDFWAVGCGPCRDDLPMMMACHAHREDAGIVFIGVHASGTAREEIEEFARNRKLTYPIYLDTSVSSPSGGFGAMMSWFGIKCIPYAVVIDRDGKVAGFGRLQDVVGKARELMPRKK